MLAAAPQSHSLKMMSSSTPAKAGKVRHVLEIGTLLKAVTIDSESGETAPHSSVDFPSIAISMNDVDYSCEEPDLQLSPLQPCTRATNDWLHNDRTHRALDDHARATAMLSDDAVDSSLAPPSSLASTASFKLPPIPAPATLDGEVYMHPLAA